MLLNERLLEAESKGYVTLCHPEDNSFSFVENGQLIEKGSVIKKEDGETYLILKVLSTSRVIVKPIN